MVVKVTRTRLEGIDKMYEYILITKSAKFLGR